LNSFENIANVHKHLNSFSTCAFFECGACWRRLVERVEGATMQEVEEEEEEGKGQLVGAQSRFARFFGTTS